MRQLTLTAGNPAVPFGGISPFAVKTVFDNYLLGRDIPFLTWTFACDVVRDVNGAVSGIVIVNRNGRQVIRAKAVVDATERRVIARKAGFKFTPFKAGSHLFERTVIAGEMPCGEGVEIVSVSEPRVITTNIRGPQPDRLPVVVTGRLYRCRMELAARLVASDAYSHFRTVALAAETLGEKRAVPVLAKLLALLGVSGHAMSYKGVGEVETIRGYKYFTQRNLGIGDKERGDCLRELCLARALFRLGDTKDALGRRTLERYAADPRRAYANHAKLVLEGAW